MKEEVPSRKKPKGKTFDDDSQAENIMECEQDQEIY